MAASHALSPVHPVLDVDRGSRARTHGIRSPGYSITKVNRKTILHNGKKGMVRPATINGVFTRRPYQERKKEKYMRNPQWLHQPTHAHRAVSGDKIPVDTAHIPHLPPMTGYTIMTRQCSRGLQCRTGR